MCLGLKARLRRWPGPTRYFLNTHVLSTKLSKQRRCQVLPHFLPTRDQDIVLRPRAFVAGGCVDSVTTPESDPVVEGASYNEHNPTASSSIPCDVLGHPISPLYPPIRAQLARPRTKSCFAVERNIEFCLKRNRHVVTAG